MDKLNEWVDSHKNVRHDWLKKYQELKEYFLLHGHTHVGAYENPELHEFCLECRPIGKRERLNVYQRKLLCDLEFAFSSEEYIWHRKYENLKIGHDEKTWCNRQRAEKKKDRLSQEKIAKLNSIGFVW